MTPESWATVPLDDIVARITTGVSVNSEGRPRVTGEVGVLKTSAVTYGRFDSRANKVIVSEEIQRARENPRAGNVLLSRMNTPVLVGASAYVERDWPDLFLPDRIWQVEPRRSRAEGRWLFYVLSAPATRARLTEAASGTSGSMKNLSQEKFLRMLVTVPPLGEQRKIAGILSSVDNAIEAAQAVIDQLQVVKKAMMVELLTRGPPGRHAKFKMTQIGEVPESWDVLSIGDLLEESAYGTSAKCESNGSGVPVLRIPNVVTESISTDNLKYANLSRAEVERYSVREGDLLVIRTNGNPNYVGRTAVVPVLDRAFLYASYLIRLRLKLGRMSPSFLHEAMRSERCRTTMNGSIRTSAGNYNLNTQGIANSMVPVPPLAEQVEIVVAAATCGKRLEAELGLLEGLRQAKSALMSALLTGEVRVTPDEDAA